MVSLAEAFVFAVGADDDDCVRGADDGRTGIFMAEGGSGAAAKEGVEGTEDEEEDGESGSLAGRLQSESAKPRRSWSTNMLPVKTGGRK